MTSSSIRWRVGRSGSTALVLLATTGGCLALIPPGHAQLPTRDVCDKLMSDTLEEIIRATTHVPNAIKRLQVSGCQGSRAACTQAADNLRAQTEANQPDKVANISSAQRAVSCIP